ncbi:MAG TPA: N-acetylornithine carbamoyltransferase [Acidimicrobiia bacterium]|nr:N-acetylornithine carbamoyltransferase [Acidimicrobiia bacterium]
MPIRNFLNTYDWSRPELQGMLDDAHALKESPLGDDLAGQTIALLFLDNSLRTRTSFDVGAYQLGGHAVVLSPSGGMWPLEFEKGSVMLGDAEEHVTEAAKVLSRYCDLIGIRAFPKFESWEEDRKDLILNAFTEHAEVPVINMETITHPCQEMALAMTLQEQLGELDGKEFVLTWSYHPKPLNSAVANSALVMAAKFGMDVTLLCPNAEYLLDQRYLDIATADTLAHGRRLSITHDIEAAYDGADVVYAKSWGALPYFGRWDEEKPMRDGYRHFIVDEKKMAKTDGALVSHCLPMRRNVIMTDGVFDSPACIAYEEAENRLHVQKAIMKRLVRAS